MEETEEITRQFSADKPDVSEIWEKNHETIMKCFLEHLKSGKTPTAQELADEADVSRKTIYEHLEQYKQHTPHKLIRDLCSFAADDVRMAIYRNAINNDMKAARLVAEMEGWIKGGRNVHNNFINQRNNTLQVNGYEFNEEMIQYLRPQQLNQLIKIIKSVSESKSAGGLQGTHSDPAII